MAYVSSPSAGRRWGLWWGIALVWWTVDGFTAATNYHRMGPEVGGVTWDHAFRTAMWSAWLWVPLTVFALWLADRYPMERETWRQHLVVHLGAAVAVCLVRALAVVGLNPIVGWYEQVPPFSDVLLTSVSNNLFLFWMLIGVGHALVYARRYREREARLARAELHMLKAQLQPHFLFNALNTITAHIKTDPETAETMVVRLSQLLRNALRSAGTQEVSLEEELALTRAYLDIEQARFEDRLRVSWDVNPNILNMQVPHLILQPLVENAVRHGISPQASGGNVHITARRNADRLVLSVEDDGAGLPAETSNGVGVANTRARLRQLYGRDQSLDVAEKEGGGVVAQLSLPLVPTR